MRQILTEYSKFMLAYLNPPIATLG